MSVGVSRHACECVAISVRPSACIIASQKPQLIGALNLSSTVLEREWLVLRVAVWVAAVWAAAVRVGG